MARRSVAILLVVSWLALISVSLSRPISAGLPDFSRTLLEQRDICVWAQGCFLGTNYLSKRFDTNKTTTNVSSDSHLLQEFAQKSLDCASITSEGACRNRGWCTWDASSTAASYGCSLQESTLNELQQKCIVDGFQRVLAAVQSCRGETQPWRVQQSSKYNGTSLASCVMSKLTKLPVDLFAIQDVMASQVIPTLEQLQTKFLTAYEGSTITPARGLLQAASSESSSGNSNDALSSQTTLKFSKAGTVQLAQQILSSLSLPPPFVMPLPLLPTPVPAASPLPEETATEIRDDLDAATVDLFPKLQRQVRRRLTRLFLSATSPHAWSAAYTKERLAQLQVLPPEFDQTLQEFDQPLEFSDATLPANSELLAPARETLEDVKSLPLEEPVPSPSPAPPATNRRTKNKKTNAIAASPLPPTPPPPPPYELLAYENSKKDPKASLKLFLPDIQAVASTALKTPVKNVTSTTWSTLQDTGGDLNDLADAINKLLTGATNALYPVVGKESAAMDWSGVDGVVVMRQVAERLHGATQKMVCQAVGAPTADVAVLEALSVKVINLQAFAIQAHWSQLAARATGPFGWTVDETFGLLATVMARQQDLGMICVANMPIVNKKNTAVQSVSSVFSEAMANSTLLLAAAATKQSPVLQRAATAWMVPAVRHLQQFIQNAVQVAAVTAQKLQNGAGVSRQAAATAGEPATSDDLMYVLTAIPSSAPNARLLQLMEGACGLASSAVVLARKVVNQFSTSVKIKEGGNLPASMVGAMDKLVVALRGYVLQQQQGGHLMGLGLVVTQTARQCRREGDVDCPDAAAASELLLANITHGVTLTYPEEKRAAVQLLSSAATLSARCAVKSADSICTDDPSCTLIPQSDSNTTLWGAVGPAQLGPTCRMLQGGMLEEDGWQALIKNVSTSDTCSLLLSVLPSCEELPPTAVCSRNPTCGILRFTTSDPNPDLTNLHQAAMLDGADDSDTSSSAQSNNATAAFMSTGGEANVNSACLPIWRPVVSALLNAVDLQAVTQAAIDCTSRTNATCEPGGITPRSTPSANTNQSSAGAINTTTLPPVGQTDSGPSWVSQNIGIVAGTIGGFLFLAAVAFFIHRWRMSRNEYARHTRRTKGKGKGKKGKKTKRTRSKSSQPRSSRRERREHLESSAPSSSSSQRSRSSSLPPRYPRRPPSSGAGAPAEPPPPLPGGPGNQYQQYTNPYHQQYQQYINQYRDALPPTAQASSSSGPSSSGSYPGPPLRPVNSNSMLLSFPSIEAASSTGGQSFSYEDHPMLGRQDSSTHPSLR